VGLSRLFSSLICTQSVGLLGRVISPSPGRYLHTGQRKHRINTDIRASSGIRTHDPSVLARAKTVYALDRAATVIDIQNKYAIIKLQ
jgi:hypothetical protein